MLVPSEGFAFPSVGFFSISGLNSLKAQLPALLSGFSDRRETCSSIASSELSTSSSSKQVAKEEKIVTDEDLNYLCRLVEVKDGGPAWLPMMDRSTARTSYQAWRRDIPFGPPQYRSRTVFEDATPELVRDFFWDDEFRPKWDDMLIYSATLEECPSTGTMIVQWIRKFPFFCSDREYIIGRRIWESGRSYYCVTKACFAVLQSWVSKKFMTGCVVLFPVAITFFITWWFIQFVDRFFSPLYVRLGIDIFGVFGLSCVFIWRGATAGPGVFSN